MALHEKTHSHSNFLTIKHGAICLEGEEGQEGYELVSGEVNGKPYSKYLRKFAAVDGRIVKIEWYSREFDGKSFKGINITLKDGGQRFTIDLPFAKRPYDYFTKIMDNIDYEQPIEFNAWLDTKAKVTNGQFPTAFIAKQNGSIIQWAYTKDNMGECPNAEQDEMGNWDFRKQRVWLFKRLTEVIIPKVEALNAFDEPEPEYSGMEEPETAPVDMTAEPPEYVDVTKHPKGCECPDCLIPF